MTNVNQISDARPFASARARSSARRTAAATLTLLSAVALGACEGDNLFDGSADDYQPVASISAPDQVVAGETVGIRVDGAAASGVAQLSVSMRGIVSKDTTIEMTEVKNSVSALLPVTIPQALQGTQLLIQAQVIDQAGRFSNIAEKMVSASGAPFVQILSTPVSVQPGQAIDVEVAATAIENVDQIALRLSGAVDSDTTVAISPASPQVRRTVRVQLPTNVRDTILNITATARDQLGNRGNAVTAVPFAIAPPQVSVIAPEWAWPGSRIQVEVRAEALRKVTELRVELRGAVVKDTTLRLQPEQVSVVEYVAIRLPGDITIPSEGQAPEITVRALAVDKSGLVSSSQLQTVAVRLDIPVDENFEPPVIRSVELFNETVIANHYADIRVTASGSRPINQIRVRWRGLVAGVMSPGVTFDLDPARLNIMEDVAVQAPCAAAGGSFLMLVTVRDESSVLSDIVTRVVTVLPDSSCGTTADTTGSASIGISAAPAMNGELPRVGSFGTPPAFLAARPFQLRTAGRRRRAARA